MAPYRKIGGIVGTSASTGRAESRPSRIGPISVGVKQMGARSAGNPHAACDVEGTGNVACRAGAPVLDPTCEGLGVKFPGPTRQSRRFDREALAAVSLFTL